MTAGFVPSGFITIRDTPRSASGSIVNFGGTQAGKFYRVYGELLIFQRNQQFATHTSSRALVGFCR
jgi:hypothetical protein